MGTIVVAHAGHWLGALAAIIPVLLVVGWILVTGIRDRRRRAGRR